MYMYEAGFFNLIVDTCKATIQMFRIRLSFHVKFKNSFFVVFLAVNLRCVWK